ncbi:histidine kinase [Alicyclobacillus hesperidum URH17-3-68]|nr:histidine kinase [Alicyclobacillus hesperidum URH17-3-68]
MFSKHLLTRACDPKRWLLKVSYASASIRFEDVALNTHVLQTSDHACTDEGNRRPRVLDFERRLVEHEAFCGVVRDFVVDFPFPESLVCLVLDADGVILDRTVNESGQRTASVDERLESLTPGSLFPCVTGALDKGRGLQRNEVVWLEEHPWRDSWQVAMVSVSDGNGSGLRNIVLVTRTAVPNLFVRQTASAIAYSVAQIWTSLQSQPPVDRGRSLIDRLRTKLQEFEKVSALAQLSAGIAHEIRNPLTTARGFLQLFGERCEQTDKAYLQLTIRELDRIQELLEDFMGLSRPDHEWLQSIDVCHLLQSVCHFLQPEASLCGVELTCSVPSESVFATVRPGRIKQVLINLVQNAVHACEGRTNGTVNLVLVDRGADIDISIVDNGCGIADTRQLFRPFHTTKPSGTGLGMFVSKHIVEAHRGRITVNSELNCGTVVSIHLPKTQPVT